MPQDNTVVGITPEEISLRGAIGTAQRFGTPADVQAAKLRYHLAVAKRRAAEYQAEAERLERELERVA